MQVIGNSKSKVDAKRDEDNGETLNLKTLEYPEQNILIIVVRLFTSSQNIKKATSGQHCNVLKSFK